LRLGPAREVPRKALLLDAARGLSPEPNRRRLSWPEAGRRLATTGPRAQHTALERLPFKQFRALFTAISSFFSSFPHGTCSLSVSRPYLALAGIYLQLRAAIPNYSTLEKRSVPTSEAERGYHPLWRRIPTDFGPFHCGFALADYNSLPERERFKC